uniref:Uncharacterized protein n=1 Tax=Anguilla anguilla TaxID=7936 RepID=A0A0E9QGS8_ANGAN
MESVAQPGLSSPVRGFTFPIYSKFDKASQCVKFIMSEVGSFVEAKHLFEPTILMQRCKTQNN